MKKMTIKELQLIELKNALMEKYINYGNVHSFPLINCLNENSLFTYGLNEYHYLLSLGITLEEQKAFITKKWTKYNC